MAARAADSKPRVWPLTGRTMQESAWRVAFAAAVRDHVARNLQRLIGPPRRRKGESIRERVVRFERWKRRTQAAGMQWPEQIRLCGSVWGVKVCPDCGKVSIKEGRRLSSCGRRFCPLCARRRAALAASKLQGAAAAIAKAGVQDILFTTFTTRVAVDDPAAYEPAAVRKRAETIAVGVKAVRKFVGGVDHDTGLHVRPDVGLGGNYHQHGILASTRFDWGQAQAIYRKAIAPFGADGNLDFKPVHTAGASLDHRAVGKAVRELCKYPGKAPKAWNHVTAQDADYDPETGEVLRDEVLGVDGGPGQVIDPALAAVHEVALYGINLNRWYGRFRCLKVPEEGDALNSDAAVAGENAAAESDSDPAATEEDYVPVVEAEEKPKCTCGSYDPAQCVCYGQHNYQTGRCVPSKESTEVRRARALLAAGRLEEVAEAWGTTAEALADWIDDEKREHRRAPWLSLDALSRAPGRRTGRRRSRRNRREST